MILKEGTVYGEPYYTVVPTFSRTKWDSMRVWCIDTFGETPGDGVWTPGARWYENNQAFWFREQSDLAYFVLRWT